MTTDQIIPDILQYLKQNNDFLNERKVKAPLEVKKDALLQYLQSRHEKFSNTDLERTLDELNTRGWIAAADDTFVAFDPALLSF